MPLLAALERQDAVRWVLMRHENAAAMAAGAHGRLTGELGVCVATSGPGALNAICGVVDADLDRVPAARHHRAGADRRRSATGSSRTSTSRGCSARSSPTAPTASIPASWWRCSGTSSDGRASSSARCISRLPSDLLATEIPFGADPFNLDPALLPRPLRLMPPPDPAFELVAAELETFRLPVIVLGRRAVGCGPAIEQLAEKLGAPIITSLDGKGIVDESHPNVLGVLGIFGFPAVEATQQILQQADVILAIGVDTIKPFLTGPVDVQHRALIQCESEFSFLTHEYHRARTLVGPLDAIADGLRDRVRARPRHPVLDTLAAERASVPGRDRRRTRPAGGRRLPAPARLPAAARRDASGRVGGRPRHRRPHPLGGAATCG